MIYTILKIILFLIGILGFFSGTYFFANSNSQTEKKSKKHLSRAKSFFYVLWLFSPFVFLFFWYISDKTLTARYYFTYVSTIIYSFYAICSAISINFIERKLKEKYVSSNSLYTYIKIPFVVLFGAFCINSSASFIRASFYQNPNLEYTYEAEIQKRISKDSMNQILKLEEKLNCYQLLLSRVDNIPENKLKIEGNLFSKIRGRYKIKIKSDTNLKVKYYENTGGKEYLPNYGVTLNYEDCNLSIRLGNGSGKKELETIKIKNKIESEIEGYKSTTKSIKTKPANPLIFTYSMLCNSLGLYGYQITGKNETSLKVDFYILWIINILLSSIIFALSVSFFRVKEKIDN